MEITFISDTHNLHDKLDLAGGEVLVHCGDVTTWGRKKEFDKFIDWFTRQEYKTKIFVAGNHDFCLEEEGWVVPSNIFYLKSSEVIVDGLKFYGHPYTPIYGNMAFNMSEDGLEKENNKVPIDTDVLITHGPPYGILDRTHNGNNVGSASLRRLFLNFNPYINAFGHIHEAYGFRMLDGSRTVFTNCSVHELLWKGDLQTSPVIVNI